MAFAADLGDLADGGDQALDTGGIGDLAVLDRHIEIGAQQHALAGEVEVVEGLEVGHGLKIRRFGKTCGGYSKIDQAGKEKPRGRGVGRADGREVRWSGSAARAQVPYLARMYGPAADRK